MSYHPFSDSILSRKVDPLARGHVEFDWDTVYADLDGPMQQVPAEPSYEAMSEMLHRLMDWVLPERWHEGWERGSLVRLCVLCWLISPWVLPGRPTMRELAQRLGCTDENLAKYSTLARQRFGLVTRSMAPNSRVRRKLYETAKRSTARAD